MDDNSLDCCKRSFGASLKETAQRLLQDPRIVPKDTAKSRLAVCESCDRYSKTQCQICQCIMPIKVTFANMRCPLDKWEEWQGEGVDEN